MRYINVMELSLPIPDFREFLEAPPELPSSLPQALSSFFSRIVFSDPETNAVGIFTQALEGVPADRAPIVLDIDVFREMECKVQGEECWQVLDSLRGLKNRIFFGSITEQTAEMFE